jgi:hypothetical protein
MWSPVTGTTEMMGAVVVVVVVVVGAIVVVVVEVVDVVEVVGSAVGSGARPDRESCHWEST